MSTLVKLLLTIVLQLFYGGDLPKEEITTTKTEIVDAQYSIQHLNPRYIITRDELLLLQKNNSEI